MKRTEFKRRTAPMKQSSIPLAEPKPPKGPRMRKCSCCGEPFQPSRIGQQVCGPDCAQSFARRIKEQQERKADKARRQSLKTRQDWLREAQAAFNAFIRERDWDQPCISCGRFHDGQWHAGHFRSIGAQASLRFDELNVHKQCAPCNNHLSGNIVEYRLRLIGKIGQVAVDWLEMDHPPIKYTIEDAQEIKARFKLKFKELQNDR